MVFFTKGACGPDSVGGVWPWTYTTKVRNRTGRTILKGAMLQLALTPGEATEIATNDSNSYIPGASNDTIWNTVIDPISNTAQGSSIHRGGIWAVALEDKADNGILEVGIFGQFEDVFVIKGSSDHVAPGDPLTIAVTTTNCHLDGVINSNEVVIASYTDNQTNLTNRRLRRVFLHQGLFANSRGQGGATAFT